MFRYSTALEKHKLFISGLPFSCTREELEEICKAHGTVKDIRLVTNRAGKPKVRISAGGSCSLSSGQTLFRDDMVLEWVLVCLLRNRQEVNRRIDELASPSIWSQINLL